MCVFGVSVCACVFGVCMCVCVCVTHTPGLLSVTPRPQNLWLYVSSSLVGLITGAPPRLTGVFVCPHVQNKGGDIITLVVPAPCLLAGLKGGIIHTHANTLLLLVTGKRILGLL